MTKATSHLASGPVALALVGPACARPASAIRFLAPRPIVPRLLATLQNRQVRPSTGPERVASKTWPSSL